MTKVTIEIAQLLTDGLATFFGVWAALLYQGQVVASGFAPIGAHLLLHPRQGMQSIDNRLTDLSGLIEQAQIGGIADRLLNNRGINDQFASVCRGYVNSGRRFSLTTQTSVATSRWR